MDSSSVLAGRLGVKSAAAAAWRMLVHTRHDVSGQAAKFVKKKVCSWQVHVSGPC
jgi:hypothetical protein